ncbi:hypothetical protein Moror_12239 [Moniliophthora roreri MCA 2997]|uniref:Uncharacterized protein n=2 Tax=Moniliophthora roreri TaxID=221103 RepID=V2XTV3_MONRO|nr:hypothetical protein Moror_12239 [Moniliophthora roreri MCA 2997]KAI3609797.1 hypothetical protein WG66_007595 [Moniliophthora roreri]
MLYASLLALFLVVAGSATPTGDLSQKSRRNAERASRRANGIPRNVTVDDSDSSIIYKPIGFWLDHTATDACSGCLHPNISLAFNRTFHLALHNVSFDADDIPPTNSASSTLNTPTQSTSNAPLHTQSTSTGGTGDDDHGGGRNRGPGGGHHVRRQDADDPGFVDQVINLQFKFTGTAVYLYAILPLLPTTSPFTTPTTTNLTFTLDNEPLPSFVYVPSGTPGDAFTADINPVLAMQNLTDEQHVLLVTVAPDAVFVFDYIVYTTTKDEPAQPLPAQADQEGAENTRSRNVATFGGAIGGSVGVLSIVALGIFISLYRRRLKAAKRDKLLANRESDNTANTDNDVSETTYTNQTRRRIRGGQAQVFNNMDHGLEEEDDDDDDGTTDNSPSRRPEMRTTPGARPFVPRYFPGTNGLPVQTQPVAPLSPQTTRDYPPPYADGTPAYGDDGVLLVQPPPLYGLSVRGEDGSIPIVVMDNSRGAEPYTSVAQPQTEQPPPSFGESQSQVESQGRSSRSWSLRSTVSTSTLPSAAPHEPSQEVARPSHDQRATSLPSPQMSRPSPTDVSQSNSPEAGPDHRNEGAL